MKNKYWSPLVFALVFVGGLLVGDLLLAPRHVRTSGQQKLMEVLNLVQAKYVDKIDMDSLVEMAIPALLSNLDPHSVYIPASDYERSNSELEGKMSGIGISFQLINDTINVIEVVSGGPSEKVGVMPGDRIIAVDGEDITNRKLRDYDVLDLLRGDKGSHVTITINRHSAKQPLTFELVRDEIPMTSVDAAYMIEPEVGYIRISRFARTTYDEFLNAANKLRLEGAKTFMIDLRGNTGGYMDPAVLIANEFLQGGDVIVSTRGRNVRENQLVAADNTGAFKDYGLIVLVNDFSASSSEIFTGAIQDNDRGWVVGRRTFGKGLVQNPIMLPDSSEIRLTVQRYYTPSGRSIQKKYTPGDIGDYESELINRFISGETLNVDSAKIDKGDWYQTSGGRTVYGGGGIMPDIFVPEDTNRVTTYYRDVINHGFIQQFAYEFCDLNREDLAKAKSVEQLLAKLPSDDVLLNSFVQYARTNGIAPRWYYINISQPLIVNQIKGWIARNILGLEGHLRVVNSTDTTIAEALKHVNEPLIKETDSQTEK